MKRILNVSVFVLLLAAVAVSCSKASSSGSSSAAAPTTYIDATVAGNSWKSATASATNPAPTGMGNITVTGTYAGETIVISVPNSTTINSTDNYPGFSGASFSYSESGNYFTITTATVTVTSIKISSTKGASSIKGTFSMTGVIDPTNNSNNFNITGGTFAATF